eukprot:1833740-Rhodomonas_salina.2
MSGYSSGFPPYFFEAALQHASPLAGYHLADVSEPSQQHCPACRPEPVKLRKQQPRHDPR